MEQLVGYRLGKYEVLSEVGRGGMKAVYRAHDPVLERDVALAVLAPHLTWEPEFVERFMREARAAAQLKHAHIVVIYDVGQEGSWYYFVMEFLEGLALKDLIHQGGAMPQGQVVSLLAQLASALDYAHRRGLVHRDVKPGNVIVSPQGHATLTDFGIVKAAHESRLTGSGMTLGTPHYMASEQIAGGEVGPWTDLYALAVVAYEMLAGRPPFDADTTPALLYQVVNQPPPPLRTLRPDLRPTVEAVFARALAKDPPARYPSGAALVTALKQALAGQEVEREAPTVLMPAQQPAAPPAQEPPVPAEGEDWDRAIAALERLLREDPDHPGTEELLASLRRKREVAGLRAQAREARAGGRFDEAIAALERLLEIEPSDGDAPVLIIRVRAEQAEAERLLRESLHEATYQRLRAALENKRWADVMALADEIPDYRDVVALRRRAEAAQAEDRRREKAYNGLRAAMHEGRWADAEQLAGQIPGYRDADELRVRAGQSRAEDERREQTYHLLLTAVEEERWTEAVALAGQIPGFRDGDTLGADAAAALAQEREREERYGELQAAVEAGAWERALDLATQLPGYREVQSLQARAEQELAQERSRAQVYEQLRAAEQAGRWEEVIRLAGAIPSDRDAIALRKWAEHALAEERRQAEQAAGEERRREEAYQELQEAAQAGRWGEVVSLSERISGYRDADGLGAQGEAILAEERRREALYRQLQAAVQAGRWAEAIALAGQLPGYADADRLKVGAERSREEAYGQLQAAVQAGRWTEALRLAGALPGYQDTDSLRQQAERARGRQRGRVVRWTVGVVLALAVLLALGLAGRALYPVLFPAPAATATVTATPTPTTTGTPTATPTVTSTPTPPPTTTPIPTTTPRPTAAPTRTPTSTPTPTTTNTLRPTVPPTRRPTEVPPTPTLTETPVPTWTPSPTEREEPTPRIPTNTPRP